MQFETLDISLQDEFDKFLAERGIDSTLAFFVPEYAEYKEQKVRLAPLGLPAPIWAGVDADGRVFCRSTSAG